MSDKDFDFHQKLFEKSIEAFLLAVETYNKPTIKYRVEVFAILICNAWELLLKAYLLKTNGSKAIYYSDNPQRSLSFEVCIRKVLTNEKDALRLNLEKIIELRNTCIHLITEEYEMVYVPLFQACVLNYAEKLHEYGSIDLSDRLPLGFLTLSSTLETLSEAKIRAKYPDNLAQHLLELNGKLNMIAGKENSKFSIPVEHRFYVTKDKNDATQIIRIAREGEVPIAYVKENVDPNVAYNFTTKKVIVYVDKALKKRGIKLSYGEQKETVKFNSFHFNNFTKYYGIKNRPELCYTDTHDKQKRYFYSQKALDFIVEELCKDPGKILTKLKTKKEPGAKENSKPASGN
jgi:hypothetical protein